MALQKQYDITLDLKNSVRVQTVPIRQNDSLTTVLNVTLTNAGQVADLTGYTIKFECLTPDKHFIRDDGTELNTMTVTDAAQGKFSYTVPSVVYQTIGTIAVAYFSFEREDPVRSGQLNRITTPNFTFLIVDDVEANGSLPSGDYFSELSSMSAQIADIQASYTTLNPSTYATNTTLNSHIAAETALFNDVMVNALKPPVPMVGLTANGLTDDTTALTNLINFAASSKFKLLIPSGTVRVTQRVNLPSYTWLEGKYGAKIFIDGILEPFYFELKTYLHVEGLYFYTNDDSFSAFHIITSSDIHFEGNEVHNMGLVTTDSNLHVDQTGVPTDPNPWTLAGYTSESNGCQRVYIMRNKIIGEKPITETRASGMWLSFCTDVYCAFNYIESMQHGISIWGGDANQSFYSGDIITNHWSRRHKYIGNTIKDVAAGGIWASLSEEITYEGNHVENCRDIGLDMEGCVSSTMIGNTVKDCSVNYATFHICVNVNIVGNVSVNGGYKYPNDPAYATQRSDIENASNNHYFNQNFHGADDGTDGVVLNSNQFIQDLTINPRYGTVGGNTCNNTLATNNQFYNCALTIKGTTMNNGAMEAINNQLNFEYRAGVPEFRAIDMGETNGDNATDGQFTCKVIGNTITVRFPGGVSPFAAPHQGIHVEQFDAQQKTLVKDNIVEGFNDSILVYIGNQGTNFHIYDNICSGRITSTPFTESWGNDFGFIYLDNNKDTAGNLIDPIATPSKVVLPLMNFDVGQIFRTADLTSGNALFSIVSNSGHLVTNAWQANTAYVVGDIVKADDRVYLCSTAGTSGSTAPTGTNFTWDGGNTDGTVVWDYCEKTLALMTYGELADNSAASVNSNMLFNSCFATGLFKWTVADAGQFSIVGSAFSPTYTALKANPTQTVKQDLDTRMTDGIDYTISFRAHRESDGWSNIEYGFIDDSAATHQVDNIDVDSNSYGNISFTFTGNSTYKTFYVKDNGDTTMYYHSFKLEQSSAKTPWKPNDADI